MAEDKTPVVAEAEKQEKILNALQAVLDPEIGLSVIDLDPIREVNFTPEEAEIKMVLTTPFCPYGPMLINHIQSASETAEGIREKRRDVEFRLAEEGLWVDDHPAVAALQQVMVMKVGVDDAGESRSHALVGPASVRDQWVRGISGHPTAHPVVDRAEPV